MDNNKQRDIEISENAPSVGGTNDEVMLVNTGKDVVRVSGAVSTQSRSAGNGFRSDDDTMSGGYASVKGRHVGGNKTVWLVLAVMAVICVLTGVLSSLLTAHFMQKGSTPIGIISDDKKDAVAAVVSARESSVVEIASGNLHGSGVITKLDGNKIYVLTNAHVINGGVPAVRFYGEDSYYKADVVGYSSYYDIAVVTVAHKTLYEIYDLDGSEYFSATLDYETGDHVVAIGNAMSLGIAAYDGIISRKSELLDYESKTLPVIRTTAAINAGMSGGALFDMAGNFVGLGTFRMTSMATGGNGSHADDVEDTGFALPASVVYPVYKQILEYGDGGEIGLLGMSFYRANTTAIGGMIMRGFGYTSEYRNGKLTVVALDTVSTPVDIKIDDVIVKIGSYEVDNDICKTCGEFLRYRRGAYTGEPLRLTVDRGGSIVTVYIDGYYKYVS